MSSNNPNIAQNNNASSNNVPSPKTGTTPVSDLKEAVTNPEPKKEDVISQTPAPEVKTEVKDASAPQTPTVTTTAAPQNAPVQQAKQEKTNTVTEKAMSVAAMYMKDYIRRYLDVNDGNLDSPAKRKSAISCFQAIMMHALKNPTPEVLDQVVVLFSDAETRTKILSESLALQGIDNSSREDQMRMSIFYQMFYDITDTTRKPKKKLHGLNMDQARSVLKSDALINYITQKFQI